ELIDLHVIRVVGGVMQRGVNGLGDFLGIAERRGAVAGIDVAAVALQEAWLELVPGLHLREDKAGPVGAGEGVGGANRVCGAVIPEQTALRFFALEIKGAQGGIDPAFGVGGIFGEFGVGFPRLGGAVVVAALDAVF